jgi:hypothetical protein
MPRPMWIGSASTKTPDHERVFEIVNIDPNHHGPAERLLVRCDTTQVAHVIWQISPNGGQQWISQLQPPPYFAYDRGVLGHPHHPQPVGLQLSFGAQQFMYRANWRHNMQFDIDPLQPDIFFKYQKNNQQPPIFFRRLRLIQQIQTATLADLIQ